MMKQTVAAPQRGEGGEEQDATVLPRPAKRSPRTPLRRYALGLLAVVGVLLIAARAYLPVLIRQYVNRTLDRIPEYEGRIGDVDLQLIAGAYSIEDIVLEKTEGPDVEPFFSSPYVEFSLEWRSLLRGEAVGEIYMPEAELHLIQAEKEEHSQTSIDDAWLQAVQDLYPFRINSIRVNRGQIFYEDLSADPPVDIHLSEVALIGTNFGNVYATDDPLPARLELNARVRGQARLDGTLRFDPESHDPTFNLLLSLEGLELVRLNQLFRAYGGFDVEHGMFSLYMEADAVEGQLSGYVKPILENVEIVELQEDSSNPIELAWEGLIGLLTELFENQRRDSIATRIPLDGSIAKPETDLYSTVLNVLRNAFISAYRHGLEPVGAQGKEAEQAS